MRILVLGAGGVGGYFGGRLVEAGRDVTFLVRDARRTQLDKTGLVIRSPVGDLKASVKTMLASEIATPFDLVILSCKAYDLAAAMDSIAPAVGEQTAIWPLLNGMAHLAVLSARFGEEKVLGGFCTGGFTLGENGHILHLNQIHTLVAGERDRAASPRLEAIAEELAGVNCHGRVSTIILQEMWEKWVFLSSLAASTCLMRACIGDIVTAGGAEITTGLLAEAQAVAEAAGHGARLEVLETARGQLTAGDSPLTASMLRDLERGGRVEADHVLGDLIWRGEEAGVQMPLFRLAYLSLKSYEAKISRI